jgi:uncharacterized RDD family membrane protein YckC
VARDRPRLFQGSPAFWRSRTTWNGIAAIITVLLTEVFHRRDLLPAALAIHAALATMFAVDTTKKQISRAAEKIARTTRENGP